MPPLRTNDRPFLAKVASWYLADMAIVSAEECHSRLGAPFAFRSMRQDVKPFLGNRLSTDDANSKSPVLDPRQRRLNHLDFSQPGITQTLKHFITFSFGGALFNVGVAGFVQILLDFFQSFVQFFQTISQALFVCLHIRNIHRVRPSVEMT